MKVPDISSKLLNSFNLSSEEIPNVGSKFDHYKNNNNTLYLSVLPKDDMPHGIAADGYSFTLVTYENFLILAGKNLLFVYSYFSGNLQREKQLGFGTVDDVNVITDMYIYSDKLYVLNSSGVLSSYQLPIFTQLSCAKVQKNATSLIVENDLIVTYGKSLTFQIYDLSLELIYDGLINGLVLSDWCLPVILREDHIIFISNSGNAYSWKIDRRRKTISKTSKTLFEKLGNEGFGKIKSMARISESCWVLCQNLGWTIYEYDQAANLMVELFSSQFVNSCTFEKLISGENNKFGIILNTGDSIWVDNGNLQVLENISGLSLVSCIYSTSQQKLVGIFSDGKQVHYSTSVINDHIITWSQPEMLSFDMSNHQRLVRCNDRIMSVSGKKLYDVSIGQYLSQNWGRPRHLDYFATSLNYFRGHVLIGTEQGELLIYDSMFQLENKFFLSPGSIDRIIIVSCSLFPETFWCISSDSSVIISSLNSVLHTFPSNSLKLKNIRYDGNYLFKFDYDFGLTINWIYSSTKTFTFLSNDAITTKNIPKMKQDQYIYNSCFDWISDRGLLLLEMDEILLKLESAELNSLYQLFMQLLFDGNFGANLSLGTAVKTNKGVTYINYYSCNLVKNLDFLVLFLCLSRKLNNSVDSDLISEYLLLHFNDGFLINLIELSLNGSNLISDISEELLILILEKISWEDIYRRYGRVIMDEFDLHDDTRSSSSEKEVDPFRNCDKFYSLYLMTISAIAENPNTRIGQKVTTKLAQVFQSLSMVKSLHSHNEFACHSEGKLVFSSPAKEINLDAALVATRIFTKGWFFFKDKVNFVPLVFNVFCLFHEVTMAKDRSIEPKILDRVARTHLAKCKQLESNLELVLKTISSDDTSLMVITLCCFLQEKNMTNANLTLKIIEFLNSSLVEEKDTIQKFHIILILNTCLNLLVNLDNNHHDRLEKERISSSLYLLLNLISGKFNLLHYNDMILLVDDTHFCGECIYFILYNFQDLSVLLLEPINEIKKLDTSEISSQSQYLIILKQNDTSLVWDTRTKSHSFNSDYFSNYYEGFVSLLARDKRMSSYKKTTSMHSYNTNIHCYTVTPQSFKM